MLFRYNKAIKAKVKDTARINTLAAKTREFHEAMQEHRNSMVFKFRDLYSNISGLGLRYMDLRSIANAWKPSADDPLGAPMLMFSLTRNLIVGTYATITEEIFKNHLSVYLNRYYLGQYHSLKAAANQHGTLIRTSRGTSRKVLYDIDYYLLQILNLFEFLDVYGSMTSDVFPSGDIHDGMYAIFNKHTYPLLLMDNMMSKWKEAVKTGDILKFDSMVRFVRDELKSYINARPSIYIKTAVNPRLSDNDWIREYNSRVDHIAKYIIEHEVVLGYQMMLDMPLCKTYGLQSDKSTHGLQSATSVLYNSIAHGGGSIVNNRPSVTGAETYEQMFADVDPESDAFPEDEYVLDREEMTDVDGEEPEAFEDWYNNLKCDKAWELKVKYDGGGSIEKGMVSNIRGKSFEAITEFASDDLGQDIYEFGDYDRIDECMGAAILDIMLMDNGDIADYANNNNDLAAWIIKVAQFAYMAIMAEFKAITEHSTLANVSNHISTLEKSFDEMRDHIPTPLKESIPESIDGLEADPKYVIPGIWDTMLSFMEEYLEELDEGAYIDYLESAYEDKISGTTEDTESRHERCKMEIYNEDEDMLVGYDSSLNTESSNSYDETEEGYVTNTRVRLPSPEVRKAYISAGFMSKSSITYLVDKLEYIPEDPSVLLKDLLGKYAYKETINMRRINPRNGLPGVMYDDLAPKVGFMVDSSGSMSDSDLIDAANFIYTAIGSDTDGLYTVYYFDTKIIAKEVVSVNRLDKLKCRPGCGGTELLPALADMKADMDKASFKGMFDILIILTDGGLGDRRKIDASDFPTGVIPIVIYTRNFQDGRFEENILQERNFWDHVDAKKSNTI